MKFTLISPYNNLNSYGVRSISTYLRNKGIAVSTVYLVNDFSTPYPKGVFEQLARLCSDSDLIGVSVMSNYFMNCVQITKELKNRLAIPIVWGGVHPTVMPEECLSHCDIAVIGEGEQTLLEIMDSMENNKPLRAIQGAFVRENGEIFKNNLRPQLPIECLPVIDNDFSSDYILLKDKISALDSNLLEKFVTRDYLTLSSFGCPFSCSYCLNNKLKKYNGGQVRMRKVDDVIKELIWVKKKMPFVRHISFDDDAFFQRNAKEMDEFAQKYKQAIGLPFFVSGLHPLFVSDEKIDILISAGLDRVRLGIQSGSEKAKILYNRPVANDKIIDAARIINKHRHKLLLTGFDIILDNPFESKEDVLETIGLLSKLPAPFTLNLFSLTFYPSTDIYERAVSAGYIKDKIEDIYRKHYLDIERSYLNFIFLLFTIFKVPKFVLKMLLDKRIVKKEIKIPKTIFQLTKLAGFARRGINFLLKGDPYTLSRHLKIRIFKV